MVAHACNSSTLGGRGGQITRGQEFESSLANMDSYWQSAVTHVCNHNTLGDSRIQDQPGQYSETPSLQKTKKLARCGGTHLQSQLLRKLRLGGSLGPGVRGCIETGCHRVSQSGLKLLTSIIINPMGLSYKEKQSLALLSSLEYSGAILAHCKFHLLWF
ncbi:hypothetical protein AAY473_031182, partial [Plecturocebus cupreus]